MPSLSLSLSLSLDVNCYSKKVFINNFVPGGGDGGVTRPTLLLLLPRPRWMPRMTFSKELWLLILALLAAFLQQISVLYTLLFISLILSRITSSLADFVQFK